MYDLLESGISPDDPSFLVQHGIRQLQLPEQYLLDLPVLGRKAHKFIHDNRLIIKLQQYCNPKIKKGKAGKDKS